MHLHKHFCATFVIFCSFCCLTSLNQHVLKNKYALFSKSNYQTNLFWFSCTLNHYLNCRCFSVEALKSQENKTVEKSVSMNTTVNGSSSSQELIQSDKSRSRKNWTNSCSQFDPCCFTNWKCSHRITCLQNTNFIRLVSNVVLLPC